MSGEQFDANAGADAVICDSVRGLQPGIHNLRILRIQMTTRCPGFTPCKPISL